MEYTIINENIAVGKDGTVSVVKVGETVCVLKQFKKTKSAKRIQKEAEFQGKACELGVAPQVFHVDLDNKQIFMQGLDKTLLEVAKNRVPACLLKSEMEAIETICRTLDTKEKLQNN